MTQTCCVAICTNTSKTAKRAGKTLRFFSFPKDQLLRRRWKAKCYRGDKFSLDKGKICSEHFIPDDFEDKYKAGMLGYVPRQLKKTAVPSIKLKPSESEPASPKATPEKQVTTFKERQEIVMQIFQENLTGSTMICDVSMNEDPTCTSQADASTAEVSTSTDEGITDQLLYMHEQIESLKKLNEELTDKLRNEQKKCAVLSRKCDDYDTKIIRMEKILEVFKSETVTLKEETKRLQKDASAQFENDLKANFEGFLTPNQIDIVLNKKTHARWTGDELSKALTLRYLSKPCYLYLKEHLRFPLPGLSTLRRWARNPDI